MRTASRLLHLTAALALAIGMTAHGADTTVAAEAPATSAATEALLATERGKAEAAVKELVDLADGDASGFNESWRAIDTLISDLGAEAIAVVESDAVVNSPDALKAVRELIGGMAATQDERGAARGEIEQRRTAAVKVHGQIRESLHCLIRIEENNKLVGIDSAPLVENYIVLAARALVLRDQAATALKDLKAQEQAWKDTAAKIRGDLKQYAGGAAPAAKAEPVAQ